MARPRAADFDQRREAITDAAASLFAERGFRGASIGDLAAACGMSAGLLYHYFRSKEDVLYEVMASHVLALEEAAAALPDAPTPERLRELTQAFMRLYVGAEARQKVLLNDLDRLPPERRAEIVAAERRVIGVVESLIVDLRPDLKGRGAELRALTMLYFGLINWTHTWFDPKGPIPPDRLADMAVDLVLNGVGGVEAETAATSRRPRRARSI